MEYGNGVYDGLKIFMLEEDKSLKLEVNNHKLEPITVRMISSEQCCDIETMKAPFDNAGSQKEIILPYELLIVAYRAVIRHDFRSTIIL